jgi:hypothetical protein
LPTPRSSITPAAATRAVGAASASWKTLRKASIADAAWVPASLRISLTSLGEGPESELRFGLLNIGMELPAA